MEGEAKSTAIDQSNERWARYWARQYGWALEGRGDLDEDDLPFTEPNIEEVPNAEED